MKNQFFNYLTIALLSTFLFASCSKNEENNKEEDAGAAITATFQFSDGKKVDFVYSPKKDDVIKPAVNGPNANNHYKLWLRGEKAIDNKVYTINLYVTMPDKGV